MGDQKDLFEHFEGASALDAPTEYAYSHDSHRVESGANSASPAKRAGNGGAQAVSGNRLDLDLDLDLTALNSLDLEDPSLDLHHGGGGQGGAGAKKKKEGGNGHAVPVYPAGLLDDAYDMEGEAAVDLPPHACAYCGIHNTSCVVKCLLCNKW